MNDRRDFDNTYQTAPPTVASPTVATPATPPSQPTAWSEQDPYDGSGGGYSPYGQPPQDTYYDQRPQYYDQPAAQYYNQPPPVAGPPEPALPWYRKPGVLFGGAAAAALIAVGALVATWQMGGVSTTPANTSGTPSQQSQVPPAPAPASPAPAPPMPSQPVVVQQPAPQQAPQYVPRQQAPAPRFVPNNPAPKQAPAGTGPSVGPPSPVPNPEEKTGTTDGGAGTTDGTGKGTTDGGAGTTDGTGNGTTDGGGAAPPPPVVEDHSNDPCFPDCGGFAGNG
jgi:hypothetical protein